MICTPNQMFQVEKNEMGGECSTYGGEERFIQGFGGETWGKETTWKDNIKMDIQVVGWEHGLDRSGSG